MKIKITPQKNKTGKSFPQANEIYNIVKRLDDMTHKLHLERLKHIKINYTKRQDSYYIDAMEYLGLLTKNVPTKLALHISAFDFGLMLCSVMKIILDDEIFYDYFEYRDKERVVNKLIKDNNLSQTTAQRRFSTVKNWIEWSDIIIKENEIDIII